MGKSQEILLSCNTAFEDCFMYLTCFYNQNPWLCQVYKCKYFLSDAKKSEKLFKQLVILRRIEYVETRFLFYL